MKIKIINPNTTLSMTRDIEKAGKKFSRPDTSVYAVSPLVGPESIESFYDEYLCAPGVISEVIKGDREEKADAFIIACFGDPGLQGAKEVTEKPVIGIAQAGFTLAKLLAPNFSVVGTLNRSKRIIEEALHLHGAREQCLSIRTPNLNVLDFDKDPQAGLKALAEQARLAVEQDGAECVVLGCAGFVQFAEDLRRELGVPVFDGVVPAVKLCEAILDMGISPAKREIWSNPQKKIVTGYDGLNLYY